MDVLILNSDLKRDKLIDKFESLIWTERASAYGDFNLKLLSSAGNKAQFPLGTLLGIKNSKRVMVVETKEDSTDKEGREILTLQGRSLESILLQRVARSTMGNLTTTPKWTITDDPAAIARKLFHDVCVTGVVNAGDVIAGIYETSIFPTDTIAEPVDVITYAIDPMTLYQATKELCDIYRMGFRMVKDGDTGHLHYDIYMGSDRTTRQTTLKPVVFSKGLDNLSNTKELTSTALYRNVAYVLSPVGSETVYADGVSSSVEGFARSALVVVAEDITSGVPATATAQMIQRGKEALAKYRQFTAFDGELNQNSEYVYGTDYNLNDLVEYQNDEGVGAIMQVTEQIFVSDKEGDRSFPTLVISSFITPGSWDAYPPDVVWDDAGAAVNWDDLPG